MSASHYPGAVDERDFATAVTASCSRTRFSACVGSTSPDLRSDELWLDAITTVTVTEPQPARLVLFNSVDRAASAHVGVVMGEKRGRHLCAEVGRPAGGTLTTSEGRAPVPMLGWHQATIRLPPTRGLDLVRSVWPLATGQSRVIPLYSDPATVVTRVSIRRSQPAQRPRSSRDTGNLSAGGPQLSRTYRMTKTPDAGDSRCKNPDPLPRRANVAAVWDRYSNSQQIPTPASVAMSLMPS